MFHLCVTQTVLSLVFNSIFSPVLFRPPLMVFPSSLCLPFNSKGLCMCFGLPQWLSGKKKKNPSAVPEMQVRSLGQEDPLEEEMATHSSFLAWDIPWREEPGGLQSLESQRVRYNCATKQQHVCILVFVKAASKLLYQYLFIYYCKTKHPWS